MSKCSAISYRREQVIFNEMMIMSAFVLDQHDNIHFYSARSLKQYTTDIHVAPNGHIILIPSQPVLD